MHCRILSPNTFDEIKRLINESEYEGQKGMSPIKHLADKVEKVQALIAYTEMTQGYEFTNEQLTKKSTIRILERKFQELVKNNEEVDAVLDKIGKMDPRVDLFRRPMDIRLSCLTCHTTSITRLRKTPMSS